MSYESTAPGYLPPFEPREEVLRGALFALIALPVGVAVWLLIWSFGFIASIVAFGVAFAALWLYRFGARGPISRAGALVVTGITAGTLLIAFFAGIVLDAVQIVSEETGLGWVEIVTLPDFWSWFGEVLPSALGDYVGDLLLALLFGAIGCFAVLRSAFRQANAAAASAAPYVATPPAPAADGVAPQQPAAGFAAPPAPQVPQAPPGFVMPSPLVEESAQTDETPESR